MPTPMTASYCDVMEMPKQWCAHCRKLPDPKPVDEFEPEAPARKGTWIAAKYDGKCSSCGGDFNIGTRIRSDGRGLWESDCCE